MLCMQTPPPPHPPTLGMGSIGQNSTFSEHGHVAYQIKGNHEMQQHSHAAYQIKENHECISMVANILPTDPNPPHLHGISDKMSFGLNGLNSLVT